MQAAKKVVLITGANKGIGFEVARQIAKVGWTVLAAARNEELGRQAVARLLAEGLDVHFVPINLNDQKIAVTAAETIRNQFGKLDLLINNAAIAGAGDGPPGKVSIETVETVFHANFVGTIAVTQAMLLLPQDAGKAQIINVSSLLGSVSLQNDPNWEYTSVKLLAYCASKAAFSMFTVQLAYELRDGNIAVNSINPGYTATDLNGNHGTQTVEEGAAEIIRAALADTPVTGRFLETGGDVPW